MFNIFKWDSEWMTKSWRPLMALMYGFCCLCDFALFPVLYTLVQFFEPGHTQFRQWNPLTLESAGFFHIAMGAVLGVSAFGRTQEKVAILNNQPTGPEPTNSPEK